MTGAVAEFMLGHNSSLELTVTELGGRHQGLLMPYQTHRHTQVRKRQRESERLRSAWGGGQYKQNAGTSWTVPFPLILTWVLIEHYVVRIGIIK